MVWRLDADFNNLKSNPSVSTSGIQAVYSALLFLTVVYANMRVEYVCCVDLVNPRRPHSGVIIIQWVTAVTLRNTPRQAFGLLPWSCAQTTICGFAMQTVKTPNSECTVSHIGGKTRHMRGHILVSRLTDHQNMLPYCTKYLLLCPKAQQARHSHSRQHVGTVRPF